MLQILSKWEVMIHTVWKFKNLLATQILREISFGKFQVSKNGHFDSCRSLDFTFWQISKSQNSEPLRLSKIVNMLTFHTFTITKLISSKI